MRGAVLDPIALFVAAATGIAALLAQLAFPWSDQSVWIVAWGAVAYVGIALVRFRTVRRREVPVAVHARPADPDPPDLEQIVHLTEDALRKLNNLPGLAACGLVACLPRTLAVAHAEAMAPDGVAASPLDQARSLRGVLVAAIDRLKPEDRAAEALHYTILQEEYVLGHPNTQVMTHSNISESTFHRYRRQGIRAVAMELARQETSLSAEH